MNKKELREGKFYLAKNGEIYKYIQNNGDPIFRVDERTFIKLDQFDENLACGYDRFTIVEEFLFFPLPNSFDDGFIPGDGKMGKLRVCEIKTKKEYDLYQGIEMFEFSDGGRGDPEQCLKNMMFNSNFDPYDDNDNMSRYFMVGGKKVYANMWEHCLLINNQEKRVLLKSFVKKNFYLLP